MDSWLVKAHGWAGLNESWPCWFCEAKGIHDGEKHSTELHSSLLRHCNDKQVIVDVVLEVVRYCTTEFHLLYGSRNGFEASIHSGKIANAILRT